MSGKYKANKLYKKCAIPLLSYVNNSNINIDSLRPISKWRGNSQKYFQISIKIIKKEFKYNEIIPKKTKLILPDDRGFRVKISNKMQILIQHFSLIKKFLTPSRTRSKQLHIHIFQTQRLGQINSSHILRRRKHPNLKELQMPANHLHRSRLSTLSPLSQTLHARLRHSRSADHCQTK